jgi:hypothetical protein
MKKLTPEQRKYQQTCKKLIKAQQDRDDALRLMQSACNHDSVACAYENNEGYDFNDFYEYRVCYDCGYLESAKNKDKEFTLKRSLKSVISMKMLYEIVNR